MALIMVEWQLNEFIVLTSHAQVLSAQNLSAIHCDQSIKSVLLDLPSLRISRN